MIIKRLFFFLIVIVLPSTAFNQIHKHVISGKVIEEGSLKPLPNVNIVVSGTEIGTTTNDQGNFELKLKRLPANLYFSHIGYGIQVIQVDRSNRKKRTVFLVPEIRELDQVVITGERIQEITRGDSLYLSDYEIIGDKLVMIAHPYKRRNLQRLYLADLFGNPISSREVNHIGKDVHFPQKPFPERTSFFKDCYGQVHLLTKEKVWQMFVKDNLVHCLYPTNYTDFLSYLFPVKCELNGSLFYQVTNRKENETCVIKKNSKEPENVKYVYDEYGEIRYMNARNVSAPIFKKDSLIYVFDFFENNIECFDLNGLSKRKVNIDFHLKEKHPFPEKPYIDLDHLNFKQIVLLDEKTGNTFAVWRNKRSSRFSLHQVNLETGEIDRIIEIPNFPNISKIKVYDNTVFFLYVTKTYPFYQTLYRMSIE